WAMTGVRPCDRQRNTAMRQGPATSPGVALSSCPPSGKPCPGTRCLPRGFWPGRPSWSSWRSAELLHAGFDAVSGLTAAFRRRKVELMCAGERWFALLLSLALGCGEDSVPVGSTALSRSPSALDGAALSARAPDAGVLVCPGQGCSVLAMDPELSATHLFRQRVVLHGDSSVDPRLRGDTHCASLGPDVSYDLDLRAARAP